MAIVWLKNNGKYTDAVSLAKEITSILTTYNLSFASGTYQARHSTDTELYSTNSPIQSESDCRKRFGQSPKHGNGVTMSKDISCLIIHEANVSLITPTVISAIQEMV